MLGPKETSLTSTLFEMAVEVKNIAIGLRLAQTRLGIWA